MFSGIVEEMGVVKAFEKGLPGGTLNLMASTTLQDLHVGESISVSGVCLTVVAIGAQDFSVDVSNETLGVTTLGALHVGTAVNLERAMKLNERIGGHLVSGHVDGVGIVRERQQDGHATLLTIETPHTLMPYCVKKGSVTVDGISLTVNHVSDNTFSIAVIPHTAKVTTLGIRHPGDSVNIETDLIGKYVERLLQASGHIPPKSPTVIDQDYLQKRGLI
ncbi:MAG: riboflavin synthase [Nitrospirales bacterium]|nr:riboflavin synthase [Nitrospirales bacterium]